jgi:hypothetical protein
MRNVILFISISINLIVFAGLGWAGYQGYKTFKSATAMAATAPIPSKIIDVIDINDGGYTALFYIVDYSGNKIVVNDFNRSGVLNKIGDTVNIQTMKNSFSGINTVNYSISP